MSSYLVKEFGKAKGVTTLLQDQMAEGDRWSDERSLQQSGIAGGKGIT